MKEAFYIPFIRNFGKCKLFYSDKKQIRDCLGVGRKERLLNRI